ncbi:DUF294 nucleotidyltransferase-like domain-containing protein [Parasphingorhabdus cellanae]|uniref:Cyclic nucleotide-binding/CBS domain-containing protein n=1 Tax=Parasphingorhabdus cellanae TaxID=2806553 RepID=A0ABX7T702_9SPHN|nr:DUF294 nucleotidyltransferase-like domain-containing protein [Parasphingorhabdus cellanae]QTD55902.1 cyclic nucleotide-binding/CBS domain-containing protein [Parasphingorhabdus cellanae]
MEIDEVISFLGRHAPFDALSADIIGSLARKIEIRYFPREMMIIDAGKENHALSIVRSGAVELRLGGTELNHRLGEGSVFGYPSLLHHERTRNQVIAHEDSLIYQLPKIDFLGLLDSHEALKSFFAKDEAERLRLAVDGLRRSEDGHGEATMISVKLETLLRRQNVITANPGDNISNAAKLMARADVSTLPLTDQGKLVGILTDKDLRRRVLGQDMSLTEPVSRVMTPTPITMTLDDDLLSAMLVMSQHNIHHLPILNAADEIVGVVSSNDLLNRFGMNALRVVAEVKVAEDAAAVARAARRVDEVLAHLTESGVDADHVARFISNIGEATHRQLLKLAEEQLGPPPISYALVVFGSLARQEQAGGSDQDNGFILDDSYDEQAHGDYFEKLATFLCDGLNSAGYIYCPGDIMATNDKWRQPLKVWKERYRAWIDKPDPDNILNTTIFFDMRCVAGEERLVDGLREQIFEWSSASTIFLSFIARAAAYTKIPLGFFRNFLLQHDEKEGDVLHLKHQAIAPVVDIARVYALALGLNEVNSEERLKKAAERGNLSEDAVSDIVDCFEFIRTVRIRHQSGQIRRGEAPTNNLSPELLSRFEREHLKDAFRVIRDHMDIISRKYAGNIH